MHSCKLFQDFMFLCLQNFFYKMVWCINIWLHSHLGGGDRLLHIPLRKKSWNPGPIQGQNSTVQKVKKTNCSYCAAAAAMTSQLLQIKLSFGTNSGNFQ